MKNNLKKIRRQNRQTQIELAFAIGVTPQTIIALERNHRPPSLRVARSLEDYYGVTIFFDEGE